MTESECKELRPPEAATAAVTLRRCLQAAAGVADRLQPDDAHRLRHPVFLLPRPEDLRRLAEPTPQGRPLAPPTTGNANGKIGLRFFWAQFSREREKGRVVIYKSKENARKSCNKFRSVNKSVLWTEGPQKS